MGWEGRRGLEPATTEIDPPTEPRRINTSRLELLAPWLLAALVLLAVALRFAKLGAWGYDSDEIFTLRDSMTLRPTNPRPLGYLLNHFLVLPFHPLDEFGIRLLPAIFGVLGIPALYFITRRLLGTRVALFSALLLTLSPLHVIYSQFGRYWSLVFLLCAIYPYAIYIGVREHKRYMLVLGIMTGILASLAHPVAVLLVGGPLVWLFFRFVRLRHLKTLWNERAARWGALAALVVLILIAVRFVPILQGWITQHDKNPGSGQFLLRPPAPPGLKQLVYLANYVEGWTVPVVIIAVLGIAYMWQRREPSLARFMVSMALFPIIFLPLLSLRTPISTYYLIPVAPVFFIGAGVFLDRLSAVDWRLRPSWWIPAGVTLLVLAAGVPTLLSQYRNGRRFDFRGVAEWLDQRLSPNDVIYSDQPVALAHYLPGMDVQRLRYNPERLEESVRLLSQQGEGGALWIVAPAPSHAFRTNLRHGGLARWMLENCRLRTFIGVGRLDFRQQYLQVFHCPASAAGPTPIQGLRDTAQAAQ